MKIDSYLLKNFRVYRELHLNFSPGLNFFIGGNGAGKSSLLESLSVLLSTRSFLGSKLPPMILKGQTEIYLAARIESLYGPCKLEHHAVLGAKSREVKIDGKKINAYQELLRRFPFVTFSSDDLDMIERGPELRRQFFDRLISYIDLNYYGNLVGYAKVLKHRNEVLKSKDRESLEFWDQELARYAAPLFKTREIYVNDFNLFCSDFGNFPEGVSELYFEYRPPLKEGEFLAQLFKNRDKDMKIGFTTAGPHRDEYQIRYPLGLLRNYASSGQKKAMAFYFKLFQAKFIERKTEQRPVLLIDDIFAELDTSNRMKITNSIKESGCQTFISSTGEELIQNLLDDSSGSIFEIKEGRVFLK